MVDRESAIIVDRGYRHYEGIRTGRRGAMAAIVREGYRRVLGLRRKARRKVLPWFLIVLALLSVVILIAITWVESRLPTPLETADLLPRYGGYFDFISVIALLFSAYVGPELLIPDRTQGVLNVYFSRPLSVGDYLIAKVFAYAAIMMSFWLVPQTIFHLALAGLSPDGFLGYLSSTTDILWKIPLAALVFFVTHASLALLIASFLNRVGAAAGVFLAGLLGLNIVAVFFLEATEAPGTRWATLLAIEQHPRYIRDWIFDIDSLRYIPERAGFGPGISLLVVGGLVVLSISTLFWRYRRLT